MKQFVALTAFLVCVAAVVAWAQDPIAEVFPGDRIAWDPADAASIKRTTHYEFRYAEDSSMPGIPAPGVDWRSVGLIREWPIPRVPEGIYTLYLRGCYKTACSGAAMLRVRILAPGAPRTPTNFLPKCRP